MITSGERAGGDYSRLLSSDSVDTQLCGAGSLGWVTHSLQYQAYETYNTFTATLAHLTQIFIQCVDMKDIRALDTP